MVSYVSTKRSIEMIKNQSLKKNMILPVYSDEMDWTSGEVPWDFKDNSTNISVPTIPIIPPLMPDKNMNVMYNILYLL